MKKFKVLGLAALLATGLVQAKSPCDEFEIRVENKLADDLKVSSVTLEGAEIDPRGVSQISARTAQLFTVKKPTETGVMLGKIVLHTASFPAKEVKLQFTLKNEGLICEHTDRTIDSDYTVEKSRVLSQVRYTIYNK